MPCGPFRGKDRSLRLQSLNPSSGGVATFRHADHSIIAPLPRDASVLGLASAPPRVHAGGELAARDSRVLRVLEIVTRQLEKPQSVTLLAACLRLSLSHFEHLFKKETGQGFKSFLRAARMTRANNMLQDPTLQVKEVAAAVGYADVCNFIHDFRKQYGQSPSQSRSPSPQQV
ncbi:MAG: helix-turn-helix transcriptional regulator [Thermoguttaceae bacterium]